LLDALGDGDPEVGHGDGGVGEAEFGVVDQLAGNAGAGLAGPARNTASQVRWGDRRLVGSPVIYVNVMIPG
jgi:hypothetical protein